MGTDKELRGPEKEDFGSNSRDREMFKPKFSGGVTLFTQFGATAAESGFASIASTTGTLSFISGEDDEGLPADFGAAPGWPGLAIKPVFLLDTNFGAFAGGPTNTRYFFHVKCLLFFQFPLSLSHTQTLFSRHTQRFSNRFWLSDQLDLPHLVSPGMITRN